MSKYTKKLTLERESKAKYALISNCSMETRLNLKNV